MFQIGVVSESDMSCFSYAPTDSYEHHRELRLELNISERGAWDLTYPTFFPSPPEGLRSQGEAVWYFYLAEIALRRLGNRILNYVYQDSSSPTSQPHIDQVITNFEDQADGWYDDLRLPIVVVSFVNVKIVKGSSPSPCN